MGLAYRNGLKMNKNISLGFIVLSDTEEEAKKTIPSVKEHYNDNIVSIIIDDIVEALNKGFKKPPSKDWNFVILGGKRVKPLLDHKMFYFIKNENDILFPLKEKKYSFIEASINGLLIHKSNMKPFMKGDFDKSKTIWAAESLERGCSFKAIVGVNLN